MPIPRSCFLVGDTVQVVQISFVSGSSDLVSHLLSLSQLVAGIPDSSVQEVASSRSVDGDYDGRQPHGLRGAPGGSSRPSVTGL